MDTDSTLRKAKRPGAVVEMPDLRVLPQARLLREQVLDKLRHAIVQGWYAPGTRLKERELCERLGVSRTSVREALRQLETEGLVHVEPRRGPIVTTITLRQAQEIYEFRSIIEVYAVQQFIVRADAKLRADLRRHLKTFVEAAKKNDMTVLIDSMSSFYDTVFAGVGNSILHTISRQLMARISYLRATSMSDEGRPKVSMREMAAIVAAIDDNDAAAARRAVLDHLAHASEAAIRQLSAPAAAPRDKPGRGRPKKPR